MQQPLTIDTSVNPGQRYEAEATQATKQANLTLYPMSLHDYGPGEASSPNVHNLSPFKQASAKSQSQDGRDGHLTNSVHES